MQAPEDEQRYLAGFTNRCIRYWYYLENGLNVLNEFRNLFLGIIALYIALHLTNLLWLIGMFIPCTIALTVTGYYYVHKFAKVKEWVSIRFSSHFGIKNFDYQKENNRLLQEILTELQK